jgi:hypothetical protein
VERVRRRLAFIRGELGRFAACTRNRRVKPERDAAFRRMRATCGWFLPDSARTRNYMRRSVTCGLSGLPTHSRVKIYCVVRATCYDKSSRPPDGTVKLSNSARARVASRLEWMSMLGLEGSDCRQNGFASAVKRVR